MVVVIMGRPRGIRGLSFLASSLLWASQCTTAAPTYPAVPVSFDPALESAAVPFKSSLFSISIEFCYVSDYLGLPSAPNMLSLSLLQNIQDRTSNPPIIRLGGDTQDVARYCATCPSPFLATYSPGNTEAIDVAYNAEFFKILNQNVPSKQRYIYGLNFKQDNYSRCAEEVHAAQQFLDPKRIVSYELGNEVDIYQIPAWGRYNRPKGWNVEIYVNETVSWLTGINAAETGNAKGGKGFPGWQIGTFAQQALYQGNFSLREVIKLGILQDVGNIVSLSEHTYFSSVCNRKFVLSLLSWLPSLISNENETKYLRVLSLYSGSSKACFPAVSNESR